MYSSLGRWCYRHPWRVILGWVLVIVIGAVTAGTIGASYSANPSLPDSDSRKGTDILNEYFVGFASRIGGTIVFRADAGIDDPEVQAAMTDLLNQIHLIDGVGVVNPYTGPNFYEQQVARRGPDAGYIAYAQVNLDPEFDASDAADIGEQINELIESSGVRDIAGLQVEVGSGWFAGGEPPESEAIGLAFSVFVLIMAVGSVVAMGMTVTTALMGVAAGVVGIVLVSNIATVPEFATTLGVMIGIGVGIDYALFIVNRYREWLHLGYSPEDSVAAALDSAGRSVVFAGATVVISLLGLLPIGLSFVAGLGVSAAVTVTMVLIGAMTLIPAIIGLVGDRITVTHVKGVVASVLIALALFGVGAGIPVLLIGLPVAIVVLIAGSFGGGRNRLRRVVQRKPTKPLRETGWYRLSRVVQSRPWLFSLGGAGLLVILALPVFSLRLGFSDEGNFPEDTTTRKAYDLLSEGFGPGANGPLIITTTDTSTEDFVTLNELSDVLNRTDGVAFATIPTANQYVDAALIRVEPTTGPQDEATEQLVHKMRNEVIPSVVAGTGVEAFVTGGVASNIDFSDYLASRMPIFLGIVLGASFLLLMAVFRSVLVPIKAVIVNMLSIGAAYGVAVAVFQWGWLGGILGVEPAPIEPFIPIMLFAIVFGLSMDYEVFLLSRIKEEYERTGDSADSVADGLAATARVITAAAAIMVFVFGSFVLEDNRIVRLFGLGLATAIAIDASIVRVLIVPSTMELLGARNWWLPRWLDRIIPNLRVEGELPQRTPVTTSQPSS